MISIIIPVYNGEKYIKRCLDALLKNHRSNYEIIIINDGSTDKTKEILANYQSHPKIKIWNQKNSGVSAARNLGLTYASGDYIMFCDSDDCYDENVILKVEEQLKKQQFDLIIFGRKDIQEDKIICKYNIDPIKFATDQYLYLKNYFCNGNHTFSVVNKVYKKCIITDKNIKFDTSLKLSEDTYFNLNYIQNCKTFYTIPDAYYLRYCNQGSAVYSRCNDFYFKNIKVIEKFEKDVACKKDNNYNEIIKELYQHYALVSIFRICDGIDVDDSKNGRKEIRQMIKDLKKRHVKFCNPQGLKNKLLFFFINTNQSSLIYFLFGTVRKKYQKMKG